MDGEGDQAQGDDRSHHPGDLMIDTLFFHPKLVHLPIALSVLMPLLAGALLLAWWKKWLPARSWLVVVALQALLLGSGVLALKSGESEEERVEKVVPESVLEAHEEAAEVFVGASGAVLGLMLLALILHKTKVALPLGGAATLGAVVVLGLGYQTGQAGGELVYRHGAANAYVNAATASGELGSAPPDVSPNNNEGDDDDDDDD